jgi:hypothetical protein
MDHISLYIRISIIFSLGVFAWLLIAGSEWNGALIRGFLVFFALLLGHKLVTSLMRMIVEVEENADGSS